MPAAVADLARDRTEHRPSAFDSSLIREHTNAGLKVARARSRVSGWSPALDDEDLAAAKITLRGPTITVEEVARRLKVAPSTLYRHLPGGRSALDGDPADSRS